MAASQIIKKSAIYLAKHSSKILTVLAILVVAGGIVKYQRNQTSLIAQLQSQLQIQQKTTADLENQINDQKSQAEQLQRQNEQQNQELTSKVDQEAKIAAQAQQEAQIAKNQLAAQQTQPIKNSSDVSLPNIDFKAIVWVVCVDSLGNGQGGSGTIIDSSGYVLTNKHVVTDSYGNLLKCGAFLGSGGAQNKLDTSIVYNLDYQDDKTGTYNNYDAAILKIVSATNVDTNSLAPMPNSFSYLKPQPGNLQTGDTLFILGYPQASSFVFTVFRGIVSSFSSDGNYINTDAIIDHGNSGGAAVTSDGRFVGIPSQKYVGNNDYLGQILKLENLNIPF